jgi:uncharacterized protein
LTLYLDTSLVVAALTREPKTAAVQDWLTSQPSTDLAISDWVVTEFSSALSLKLRTAQLIESNRAVAFAQFAALCAQTFTVLQVSGLHCRTAARFADQHTLGLRAGDALHLAICADHGATICTLDRRQSDAGLRLGVSTLLL